MAPAQAVSATDRVTLGRRGMDGALHGVLRALARRLGRRGCQATQITTGTAEEMALHLVIDAAEGAMRDGTVATDLPLPARPDRDEDFDAIRELYFCDHDVLLLFDASLDGIEARYSVLDDHGLSWDLHPQAWFLPFEDHGLPRRGA